MESIFLVLLLLSLTSAQIQYSGRVSQKDSSSVQFDWSAIRIDYSFTGTSIAALLEDTGNFYDVFIDNSLYTTLSANSSLTNYTIATGLSNSLHTISMIKRTEAFIGNTVTFSGFVVDGNTVSPLPVTFATNSRKIEFIGDSITCGYGVLGVLPCTFSAQTESAYYSYASVVSRYFGAQLFMECWSGKGVVRNYDYVNATSPDPLPSIYPRAIATSGTSATWNFTAWVPDALVINLGTNDFSTTPNPDETTFTTGYINFLNYITGQYNNPSLEVFLVCGPLIGNPCCTYVQQIAITMGSKYHFINMQNILNTTDNHDLGCDYHPNVIGEQKMADIAIPAIASVMGWTEAASTSSTGSTTSSTSSSTSGAAGTSSSTSTSSSSSTSGSAGTSTTTAKSTTSTTGTAQTIKKSSSKALTSSIAFIAGVAGGGGALLLIIIIIVIVVIVKKRNSSYSSYGNSSLGSSTSAPVDDTPARPIEILSMNDIHNNRMNNLAATAPEEY